jgi:hypothetical protein
VEYYKKLSSGNVQNDDLVNKIKEKDQFIQKMHNQFED